MTCSICMLWREADWRIESDHKCMTDEEIVAELVREFGINWRNKE